VRSTFKTILNLGVNDTHEYLDARRIRIVNLIAFACGSLWLLFSFLVLSVGFYIPAIIDFVGAIACLSTLYLNKINKQVAGFYSLSFGSLICLTFISVTFGRESGAHFFILVWIVMSLFIMRSSNRSIRLVSIGAIILVVLEYIFNNYEPIAEPPKGEIDPALFQYVIIPFAIGSIIAIIRFFKSDIQVYEDSLHEKNNLLEQQKEEIFQRNKEIRDSIEYAKRIQNAILPPLSSFQKNLPNSFVLYKPKDIVAGDFYWMEKIEDRILFAAADCTGHGVPGAMVSVVCNGALKRSVREFGLKEPGEILDKSRELIVREFDKADEDVKDGMDIALCSLEGRKLLYSGAHNPLWILRNGELIETKANKQPIGKFENIQPFNTHTFELEKGDLIYVFSDGLADQFGGPRGKKFKAKSIRKLLLEINELSMDQQKDAVDKAFEDWKGQFEQVDDVCLIGVRVN
jgi:serine phosphatase RsbU (regulator of sigma subunit)